MVPLPLQVWGQYADVGACLVLGLACNQSRTCADVLRQEKMLNDMTAALLGLLCLDCYSNVLTWSCLGWMRGGACEALATQHLIRNLAPPGRADDHAPIADDQWSTYGIAQGRHGTTAGACGPSLVHSPTDVAADREGSADTGH